MSEAPINEPVSSEVAPIEDTNPLVVEIDETRLRQLEAHLTNLWEQYSELVDKERHRRLGPNATSIPPRVVFRTEFEIRAGYHLTQNVIRELLEGKEFYIRSKVTPGTGTIEQM